MPVSTLRCTRTVGLAVSRASFASASRYSGVYAVAVRCQRTSSSSWAAGCSDSTRIGARIPDCRSAAPSCTKATHSPSAPASSAARATAAAPWP